MLRFHRATIEMPLMRYLIALAAVIAAYLLRAGIGQAFGVVLPPYFTFYPAIMIVAVFGGLLPGLFATALSVLVVDLLILPPAYSFKIAKFSDMVILFLFALIGACISILAEKYRKARVTIAEYEAQRALSFLSAKFELALASMSDAVFISDEKGRIVHFNDAFATFHRFASKSDCSDYRGDYSAILEISQTGGKPLPHEDWPISRALRGGIGNNVEFLLRRKDTGDTWLASYNYAPLRDEDGRIVGAVVSGRDITKRRQAEELVRRRTALFEAQVNSSRDGVLVIDANGQKILHNRQFVELWGIPNEIAENPDAALQLRYVKSCVKDAKPFVERIEYLNAHPEETCSDEIELADGRIFDRYTAPVRDDAGNYYGRTWIVRDITASKQAEELLRQSELHYRNLFTSIDEGACVVEVIFDQQQKPIDLKFVQVNAAYEKQTGLPIKPSQRISEYLPHLEEYWLEAYAKVALTGESGHFVNSVKETGGIYDVHSYRVGEPELHQVAVLFNEIGDRVRAEEALRKSEQHYRNLFTSMDEGAMVIEMIFDANGKPVDFRRLEMNPAYEKQTGLKSKVGQRARENLPNIDDFWLEAYGKVALTGEPAHFIHPLKETGANFEVHAFRVGEAQLRQVAVVFSNITERVRAEEHIQRLNRIYSVLSETNGVLIRVKDPAEILAAACRIAVEKGGFLMAWAGMVDPETSLLVPVISAGYTGGYLDQVKIDLRDPATGTGPAAHAFHSGRHFVCNNIAHELYRPWKNFAIELGYRSLASFPLTIDGKVKGVFNIYANEPGYFNEDELRLLDDMAGDISFALEVDRHEQKRRRAEANLAKLNRTYAVLSDVNQTIVRVKDSHAMLEAACRIAVEKGKFLMAWAGLYNPETGIVAPVASAGRVEEFLDGIAIDIRDSSTPMTSIAQAIRSGHHNICNNLEELPARSRRRRIGMDLGFRSAADFPLAIEGRPAGVLCFYSGEAGFFDEEELRLLDEMAMDISFALEVNLHEQQRHRAEIDIERLNRVYAVLSAINETLVRVKDSGAMLEAACRIAVEKGSFLSAWAGIVNPETGILAPSASAGVGADSLNGIRIETRNIFSESGPAGLAFQSGRHFVCNNIQMNFFDARAEKALGLGYCSVAAFPLTVEGRVHGIFCIHAGEVDFFNDQELRLLDEMASDISFALEVDLHEQQRRRAEVNLAKLNRIYAVLSDVNVAIVRVKDSQAMLEAACCIAVEKGKFLMAWAGLLDPETGIVAPIASAGRVEDYLDGFRIDIHNPVNAQRITAKAFQSARREVCNNLEEMPPDSRWRRIGSNLGYRSAAAFPLTIDGRSVGLVNLYSGETGFFDEEELRLLDEMAMDISFALEVNQHEQLRRRAEVNLAKLNRTYAVLSDVNQTIVRVKESSAMLEAACRIAVEKGKFLMAWVGLLDPQTGIVGPIASAGCVGGFLDGRVVDVFQPGAAEKFSAGALISGHHKICNNIEELPATSRRRRIGLDLGYRSAAAFPLTIDGRSVGIFNLYSGEAGFFDADELRLLDEMATDISFALEVNQHEQKRQLLEEDVAVHLRELQILNEMNEALLESTSEIELLHRYCRIAVETAGYRMAWVGFAREIPDKQVVPVAWAGHEDGYLSEVKIMWDGGDLSQGPTGRAVCSGKVEATPFIPDVARLAPFLAAAEKRGYEAVIALPFETDPGSMACLSVYSATRIEWSEPEQHLMRQVALALGYGIRTLRGTLAKEKYLDDLRNSLELTVQLIADIVDRRDPYTAGHQRRVANLSARIARKLALNEERTRGLRLAATIHDLGKIGIPAELLAKPTGLSRAEFTLVKEHSQIGFDIVRSVSFPWPIADMIHQHHERMNGSGYPKGISGDAILLESRILAGADVVEAMASHRPYRAARGIDVALEELLKDRGTLFDSAVVDACVQVFREDGFTFTS